jgi:predicted Zn finger-like uncharacterized protein
MPTTIHCPQCDRALQVQDTHLGKQVRCPSCKTIFKAEAADERIAPVSEYEEEVAPPPRRRPAAPPPEEYEDEDRPRRRRRRDDDDDLDFPSDLKPHRGGTVLTLGILSIVPGLCCALLGLVLGIIAISMGNTDLQAMARGRMDRSGQGSTKAGWICGIIGVVLAVVNGIAGVMLQLNRRL